MLSALFVHERVRVKSDARLACFSCAILTSLAALALPSRSTPCTNYKSFLLYLSQSKGQHLHSPPPSRTLHPVSLVSTSNAA